MVAISSRRPARVLVAALGLVAAAAVSADCGVFTGVAVESCWNISSYTQDTDRIVGWQVMPDGSLEYVVVENGTNVGSGSFSGDSTNFTSWWTDYIHGVTNDPTPDAPGFTSSAPEPQTWWMLGSGLAVVAWAARRTRRA
mgnify:CR=1 FL=1